MKDIIEVPVLDTDVIIYTSMKDDLNYSIQKLRRNINNAEALLTQLTLQMLEDDEDIDAMTLRYTTISAQMNKDIELLQKARKDVSIVVMNLNKASVKPEGTKHITNNLTIETTPKSTLDIIKELKASK